MLAGSLAGLFAYVVAWPFGIRARVQVTRGLGVFYCRVGGISVDVHGVVDRRRPVLYVCNHMSYLDIVVIGSVVSANFVSKADVVDWPVIGLMARLNDTILIDRQVRDMRAQCAMLRRHLENGHSVILFPEGTSGDGNGMLPFRSSLFDAAAADHDGAPVRVQPVSLVYTRLNGCPVTRWQRPYFAWYGDMPLAGHLWRCLGLGRTRVDLVFHESVCLIDFPSRKALSAYCERQVAQGVRDALAGYPARLPAAAPDAPSDAEGALAPPLSGGT
jgi:1-acyl-sn-glycerol-3-phosphate acyltransferase